jgi:hypothetical protein
VYVRVWQEFNRVDCLALVETYIFVLLNRQGFRASILDSQGNWCAGGGDDGFREQLPVVERKFVGL